MGIVTQEAPPRDLFCLAARIHLPIEVSLQTFFVFPLPLPLPEHNPPGLTSFLTFLPHLLSKSLLFFSIFHSNSTQTR